MMCCCFLRPMRKHLTNISYIARNVVVRALLVILRSNVRLVPSFVELHCGTVFGCDRLFLLAITRLRRELDPNSPPNCFKRETTVVALKSRGKWQL